MHGEGETLARHEKILTDLAFGMGIVVEETYREIVSGESIAARPEMLRLLDDIENDKWDGVLVVEIERLARGDSRDQGLLLETFKYHNVKIITPLKTYDPNDEFDEEYAEFGLFMSRREYKTIKRRLVNGKKAAAKEGKFVGALVPYGYEKIKLDSDKGYSLRPVPREAEVVRSIFEMYTRGTVETKGRPVGMQSIATILNDLHIPPQKSDRWAPSTIRGIITNCVYAGKIQYGRRSLGKSVHNGVVTKTYPVNKDYPIYNGIHQPLIDPETWLLSQKIFADRTCVPNFRKYELQNPFASLLRCGECRRSMTRRPLKSGTNRAWIICKTHGCPTVGADLDDVEKRIIDSLAQWLHDYKLELSCTETFTGISPALLTNALSEKQRQADDLKKQLDHVYQLLETDVYSIEVFRERSGTLTDQLNGVKLDLEDLEGQLKKQADREKRRALLIPKFEGLLDHYWELSAGEKNDLLSEVVERIEYFKSSRGTKRTVPDFTLKIYPRL